MARMKRAARGLQADLIASATGKNKEPEFSAIAPPTKVELARALSFYSASKTYKPEDYKTMALSWVKKNRPELVDIVQSAKPYRFQTFGPLMRMNARGMVFDPRVEQQVNDFLASLTVVRDDTEELDEEGNLIVDKAPAVKKPRKAKVNPNMQAFDDELDNVMVKWNPKDGVGFEIDPSHEVAPLIARCEDMLDTFKEEGVQQYPLHMKLWLKAVISKLSTVQKIVKVRKPRKQRVRKVNPLKMTAKVKYLKSDPELKIDSKSPVDIIGKSKVYIYDTKYKKISKLVCAEASGFIIKGTTIMNFDPDKSAVTFIRKPQTELRSGMGIRELDRVMNSSKSKRKPEPKGRLNENTLILNIS